MSTPELSPHDFPVQASSEAVSGMSDAMEEQSRLRFCELTPAGRGAVATLGLSGDLSLLNNWLRLVSGSFAQSVEPDRVAFGYWGTEPAEEVVYLRTSADRAEVHCHGGLAAVSCISRALLSAGARQLTPEEWLQLRQPIIEAECQLALSRMTTRRTAHLALRQCELFPQAVRRLTDCAWEEVPQALNALLAHADFGLQLSRPRTIVLSGRPNVGKSSLINALVGFDRSIVYDQPGTTRDVVGAETVLEGWPAEFFDTAGIRRESIGLEAAGIERARDHLNSAQLVIMVLDAQAGEQPEDADLLAECPQAMVIWNKCDLETAELSEDGRLRVSARTGAGIDRLIAECVRRLVPDVPDDSQAYPLTDGQVQRLRTLAEWARHNHRSGFQQSLREWTEADGAG